MTKKIAIVGSSPRSYNDAPYDDPSWEIWGLNHGATYMKRWDRLFDLHDLTKTPEQYERLKTLDGVWTRQEWPGLNSQVYPVAEIIETFRCSYFTNTVSYMIALAMYEEAQEIGVWGVDMAVHQEYREQRPSCEYWLGLAEGRGIKISLPEVCELLKTSVLYGYDLVTADDDKMRAGRVIELNGEVARLQAEIAKIRELSDKDIVERERKLFASLGALEEVRLQGRRK
jgi:hypothetical protein